MLRLIPHLLRRKREADGAAQTVIRETEKTDQIKTLLCVFRSYPVMLDAVIRHRQNEP